MNRYEVNLITALTKYFILGEYYSPQKITIIAMYKAQCDIIERVRILLKAYITKFCYPSKSLLSLYCYILGCDVIFCNRSLKHV
jgi:hypothetical protein